MIKDWQKTLKNLKETVTTEFKLAAGRYNQGQLPEDFWPTYSAFANTRGGVIVLGIKEKNGQFEAHGLSHTDKIVRDLATNLNNKQKVSVNLLSDEHIKEHYIAGNSILFIEVPVADRKQRPVYLKGNPFNGNTYRRLHDGDRHCDDETVKRMLAEQIEDNRDARILSHYTIKDLHSESLSKYRKIFSIVKPGHPWTQSDDKEFIKLIGGWRCDRNNESEGLTLAGLLMFGNWPTIQENFPNYFLDYQEHADDSSEARWIDRLVPDGTWSGNIFEFYHHVSRKINADLKIPFQLKNDIRTDESLIHQALRESLVNTLVHADYSGRAAIKIVKKRQGFLFRNPGGMRIPPHLALDGGDSDCRNRLLQSMFLRIGIGETAGSGLHKIKQGWEQNKGTLSLEECFEPYEHTQLSLFWPKEEGNHER